MRPQPTLLAVGAAWLIAGCGTNGAVRPLAGGPPRPGAPATAAAPAVPPAPSGPARPPAAGIDLDALVERLWAQAGVVPAAPADDGELLRRATLDVVGRIPTLEEVESFLADPRADKRARLVDRLLASPEYAEHWADRLVDLFVGRQFRKPGIEKRLDPRAFFVAALRENRPYDRMAREMLTFSGEIAPGGAGVFMASHLKGGGPEAMASATARLFLGVQIQCAQCHDHPYDARYKQEDFYGLVAYFARARAREEKPGKRVQGAAEAPAAGAAAENMMADPAPASGTPSRSLDARRYFVIDKPNGRTKFKRAGADRETPVAPRFLGRQAPAASPDEPPRETLARAVVESDLFAKAVVGRIWAALFGRGIVEPWDDLGGERDPRHPALLTALAGDFRASGHDVKRLLRTLLLSRAYGLTSRATATPAAPAAANTTPTLAAGPAAPDPTAVFARAAVRKLTPEQLFRSLTVATGADRLARADAEDLQKKVDRALREYLFVFGDDEMAEVDTFNGNVPQALLLWNGDITNQGARARAGGTLARVLEARRDPAARLNALFLACYGRPPTPDERERLTPAAAAGDRPAAWEDLFFALLTSTEMQTNH